MFRNYFIIALRSAERHKLYSIINLVGLTVGLTCAILLGLYVRQELSFDSWIPGHDNLYRISGGLNLPGQKPVDFGAAPIPLGPAMVAEIPGIVEQTRIVGKSVTAEVMHKPYAEWINTVDGNFFTVIRLPFLRGDPRSALSKPENVVLDENSAHKYFGDGDPIGRTILLDKKPYTVTAIVRDMPYNTQFYGGMYILFRRNPPVATDADRVSESKPKTSQQRFDPEGWTNYSTSLYVRLAPGVDPRTVEQELPFVFERHASSAMKEAVASLAHISIAKFNFLKLVPFTQVHLTTGIAGSGVKESTGKTAVYGLVSIAVLVLLIACFNFTNLATACASLRAREVGLRKAVGASRGQLIGQFLLESVLTAYVSLVLALAAVEFSLPHFSAFVGHDIVFDYFGDWHFTLACLAVATAAGLLGGVYPALVLSRFNPVAALRPVVAEKNGHVTLRTVLVVLQFAVSIALGIDAAVVFAQTNYARHIDLGFDSSNVLALSIYGANLSKETQLSLVRALSAGPGIHAVALSDQVPPGNGESLNFVRLPGDPRKISVQVFNISPEFSKVYGLTLKSGRLLSHDYGKDISGDYFDIDDTNVVIDENAARTFGFTPQNAIGKELTMAGGRVRIVGVIQSILYRGAHAIQVVPSVYFFRPNFMSTISLRLTGTRMPQTLAFVDRTWHAFAPDRPIVRWFVGDNIEKLYENDVKQGILLSIFVAIAIVIASLGLFGLAAFTVEQHTKEIGLRKVFGADTADIVRLLLWQFSKPVLIANLFAWPAAWYYLHGWLESFAYRIDLSPFYFLAAGIIALLVAWLTVIGHALHVAKANPIVALRYE